MILTSKTSSPVRRAAAPAPRLRGRLLVAVITSVAFALALLLVIGIEVWLPTTYVRSALGVGFLGAFTPCPRWSPPPTGSPAMVPWASPPGTSGSVRWPDWPLRRSAR
ncbi:MAG TPA: hypothetical protein VHN80_02545 [Kineosporiaceae bacterium]|nr:hypothetical protein [Kineosporiaceae bacterium]